MKEKPLLALNLLWAALAIGAFFAGSMATKHRMSRSAESDTGAKPWHRSLLLWLVVGAARMWRSRVPAPARKPCQSHPFRP